MTDDSKMSEINPSPEKVVGLSSEELLGLVDALKPYINDPEVRALRKRLDDVLIHNTPLDFTADELERIGQLVLQTLWLNES